MFNFSKTKTKKHKNIGKPNCKRGSLLVYVLVGSAIAVTVLSGLLIFVGSAEKRSSGEASRYQALQVAESGVYFYKWYLAHNLDGKNATQIRNFWASGNALGVNTPYEKEVTDVTESGEVGIGKYRVEVVVPSLDATIVQATVTGWTYKQPNIQRRVKVRFRRPSWSEYSVLANDVLRFGSGTNAYGPIHSNNGIRFDGVAHNRITSAMTTYVDPDTGVTRPGVWTSNSNESATFLAGKKFPVSAKDFNGVTTDLALIKSEAQNEGLFFPKEIYYENTCGWYLCGKKGYGCCDQPYFYGFHFKLNTNDTVEVWKVSKYNDSMYNIINETGHQVFSFPSNGLIFAEGNVWVEGQINTARLTIAAANLDDNGVDPNIYIENDILYTNKDGQDVLGLIAENNITVGHHSESDLEIDAALLAQKGHVGRDYYNQHRDTITVYGAIATNQRYGFAYTDGTGYQTRNLYFDNNLLYGPPPFFPTGTVYELDLWEDL